MARIAARLEQWAIRVTSVFVQVAEDELAGLDGVVGNVLTRGQPGNGRLRDPVGKPEVLSAIQVDARIELVHFAHSAGRKCTGPLGVLGRERGLVAAKQEQKHVDGWCTGSTPQPALGGAL